MVYTVTVKKYLQLLIVMAREIWDKIYSLCFLIFIFTYNEVLIFFIIKYLQFSFN